MTIRSSLYIASRSFNVSFSTASRVRIELLARLTFYSIGISGRIGIVGSTSRSGSMYFQVSPPSAIVFITNSHGSQSEGLSRITTFVVEEAMIQG